MGSWSETIMGGDGPLDAQHDVLMLAGFDEQDYERNHADHLPEVKDLIERIPDEGWLPFFNKGRDERQSNNRRRVAAVLIMQCGAPMPKVVVEEALKACEEDTSDWHSTKTRAFYLQQFADQIKNYDGTPTQTPSEDLFDKISEHISPGRKRSIH